MVAVKLAKRFTRATGILFAFLLGSTSASTPTPPPVCLMAGKKKKRAFKGLKYVQPWELETLSSLSWSKYEGLGQHNIGAAARTAQLFQCQAAKTSHGFTGTFHTPFQALQGQEDGWPYRSHFQSLTFQQPYQHKSFEELRLEDYQEETSGPGDSWIDRYCRQRETMPPQAYFSGMARRIHHGEAFE